MNETSTASPRQVRKRPLWASILLIIAGVLVLAFVAIQFIPVNRANPPVTTQINWDSAQTKDLAYRACMDCHSNETVWPWYSYIAPVSWLVYYDVQRGRSELNFSTLGAGGQGEGGRFGQPQDLAYQLGQFLVQGGQRRGPGGFPRDGQFQPRAEGGQNPGGFARGGREGGFSGRITENIQNNTMPPANYLLIHASANLTSAEKQQLIQGLLKTMGQPAQ